MSRLRDLYNQYCESPELLETAASDALKVMEGTEQKQMRFQAEAYRHWAQLAAIAGDEASRMKDHVKDVVWSDCYLRAASSLEESGQKATESRIEAVAKRDPAWARHLTALRDSELRAATFRSIEQGMLQKKEMLQSLNARQCRELGDL